ncbi:Protein transport protein S9 plasma membrane t-SNARE [Nowakowskiella sp. JEL0078]|nr:Protein transport protein S9 plasma membrane t-SNARE [Nowakowskiella sp. JEL0078]
MLAIADFNFMRIIRGTIHNLRRGNSKPSDNYPSKSYSERDRLGPPSSHGRSHSGGSPNRSDGYPNSRSGSGRDRDVDYNRDRDYDRDRDYGRDRDNGRGYERSSRNQPQPRDKWAAPAAERDYRDNGYGRDYRDNGRDDGYRNEQEEYEYLQQETRQTQQDSVESTRRALGMLYDTEDVARGNMEKLNLQSEKLNKIEGKLDEANQHIAVSEARTDHLKNLSRSFLLPTWGAKKTSRKEAELVRKEEERAKRMEDSRAEQDNRRKQFQGEYDRQYNEGRSNNSHTRQHGVYTTPNGVERDDTEREIDSNLDLISGGLGRLKMMAQGMNNELENQHKQLDRISDGTSITNDKVNRARKRVDDIGKRK